MSPDQLFALGNPLALIGWIVLLLSPLSPKWADRISGVAIPLILSVGYAGLILSHFSRAEGGFDSLENVMLLFTNPHAALAGWWHFLAFDLLIGAWIARTARAERIHFALVIPCFALTFMFGPMGFLTFSALRFIRTGLAQGKEA